VRNYLNLKKERRVRKNMRKTVLTFLIFAFLLLVLALFSSTFSAPPPIKRPMELKSATIEGASPETVDPAWCYDTASAELIFNVYETLIFFNGEHVDQFLPQLATEWTVENITGTVSPDGLSWYYRYTFKIRPNVQWHDSIYGNVTPADVEYSFERGMVQDRDGGPQWMIYEPLLNTWGAKGLGDIGNATNPGPDVALVGKMIDHAVASNDTHVWFNLAFPNVYPPFMQILAKTCSSILCKAWINNYVIDTLLRPDWSGDWMAGGGDHTEWINYHDPEISPLDLDSSPVMMGSGPFSFGTLDYSGQYWSVNRFVNYWRGWPADWPAPSGLSPAGYVDRVEVTWAYNWEQRSAMFLNGDVDFCAVPRMYKDTVLNKDGIRCIWPLPTLAVDALFYTFDIDPTTPYGPINDYGVFSSDAIPRDFFGNPTWGIHVRKAFSYAFDYDTYLSVAFLGYEAIHPATAIIPGLLYYDPSVKGYEYNVTAAEEEFKKVPGLWDTGFNITLVYDTDSTPKTVAANLLKTTLENLNPGLFSVTVTSCNWRSYVRAIQEHKLPIFIIGWQADFADPHNFVYPFYYTYGTFAYWQGYSNPVMDELIERGIATPDGPERAAIYHDIQVLAVEDVPSTTIDQAVGRHFERDWIDGWYYNALYPGGHYSNLWKWYYVTNSLYDQAKQPQSNLLPVDVNYDGKVDMKDVGTTGMSFGSWFGPPIHPRWVFRCDFNNDRKIDMKDVGLVARNFGKTSDKWTPATPPAHDLMASISNTEPGAKVNVTKTPAVNITCFVINFGTSDETGVVAHLSINGTEVRTEDVGALAHKTTYTFKYVWSPSTPTGETNTYSIELYVTPVSGEENTANNLATAEVLVVK
jgi:peptide/nickel transport system substrate-binding protein